MPNTPSPRPDVERIGKEAHRKREKWGAHPALDDILALTEYIGRLEAVVKAAQAMDAGWRGAGPAGQAIVGYWCEYCGEGHAEHPKILHSALCKIFQFNQRLAALGDGDG